MRRPPHQGPGGRGVHRFFSRAPDRWAPPVGFAPRFWLDARTRRATTPAQPFPDRPAGGRAPAAGGVASGWLLPGWLALGWLALGWLPAGWLPARRWAPWRACPPAFAGERPGPWACFATLGLTRVFAS